MQIEVLARPSARRNAVEVLAPNLYRVTTTAPPNAGRANNAIIKLLAQHFDINRSQIILLRGETSSHKLFSIDLKV